MSDPHVSTPTGSSENRATNESLKDQAADAGTEMKQRAGDAFRASADVARDKFKEAADSAKEVVGGTAERVQEQARGQQRAGADFMGRFADHIREAARAFEADTPFAARGINSAADYVDETADKIRNGSFGDLVDSATDFARRRPTAFLGISVLAGFAAVRFLKASGDRSSSARWEGTARQTSSRSDESWNRPSARPPRNWDEAISSKPGGMS
ncbi:hypothetical protein I6F35_29410 [Bradyrhizobium sp. BRP22]|uniref:hypothetical protein n=1 Tax=Bradyrhizobium sp. BRP22 TaxID=2793821 RepID=UPI001CD72CB4|nr:hypothetical protein [Bradyrhizobium sp. BRP22]MCA1457280.1 hypothetical protein [Bradyrhizobium sp. BRP22]